MNSENTILELVQGRFKNLPSIDSSLRKKEVLLPAFVTGSTFYAIVPELVNANTSGITDELSAIMAAAGAGLIASGKKPSEACQKDRSTKADKLTNYYTTMLGSTGLGVAIAALIPGFTILIDGGITLVAMLLGGGFASVREKFKLAKDCPHCGHPSDCSKRVCRKCYCVFYPEEKPIECSLTPGLDWYQVVSHLHRLNLNYLDSEKLLIENIGLWSTYKAGNKILIDCKSLIDWITQNTDKVYSYIGKGAGNRSDNQLDIHLLNQGM